MADSRKYDPMLDAYIDEQPQDWCITALGASFVKVDKVVEKPKIIFSIREQNATSFEYRRVFTRGNFSAIIGKAKSKKTFLLSAITSSILAKKMMWNKFVGQMQEDKDLILYFDTEQGEFDSWSVMKRITDMAGVTEGFKPYNLREFTPMQRCELIEYALSVYGNRAGYVVIDGIADLANAYNDEEEASRVVTLLMKWTKIYDLHIATIIHQNKGDGYATGHLGSAIMRKCEVIVVVTKDDIDDWKSVVKCDMIRGTMAFKPFQLTINQEGIPEIDNVVISLEKNDINDDLPF